MQLRIMHGTRPAMLCQLHQELAIVGGDWQAGLALQLPQAFGGIESTAIQAQ